MALGQDSPASERITRPLSRSQLRKAIGPSNPLYGFLMQLAIQDLAVLHNDDFLVSEANAPFTDVWNADASSANATDFAQAGATVVNGQLTGNLITTADAWIRLVSVSEGYAPNYRPMVMTSIKCSTFDSDDDTLKIEFGLAENLGAADNAAVGDGTDCGQVNVKATPTTASTAADDYTVVILDTDDNLFWDVVGDDDGTPATTNVAASVPWNPTQTSDTTSYTASTIAFVEGGASADTITDSANGFGSFAANDVITVTGSTRNNGTYTVTTAAAGTLTLSTGQLNTEAAGQSVTITTPDLSNGDDQWQTIVVAQNENNEGYGWINGHFIGRLAGGAPDDDTMQHVHLFCQNRGTASADFEVDYIKGWQERSAIS